MSGILGHIHTNEAPVDTGRFKTMLDAMHLRGPDGGGLWFDQYVGFGHRMLRSTPEAHVEKLPLHDPECDCVITSDARLDNRLELIETLGRDSFKMEVVPDSVIILKSYLKWGRDCVHHLLGDFAFAIWDIKEQKLFCARDFLGVKPFNYCFVGGTFLFCSEPRVIAKYSGLSFRINEPRIADSLTPHLEGYDTTSTFYEEIFRLPPAHILVLKAGSIQIDKYWKPEPQTASVYKTDDDYREALTEILTRAVVDRCRGDETPAILQSGGVDSAVVMGIARNYYRDVPGATVHTYSGVAEDIEGCKESQLITLLSGQGDINSHLYSPKDLGKHIELIFELVSQLGEPFDIYMMLQFLLYQQAASNGRRFMLDGVDGDVVASLSSHYPLRLLQQLSFKKAWHETYKQSKDFFDGAVSPYRKFGRYCLSAFAPQVVKDLRWSSRMQALVVEYLNDSPVTERFSRKVEMRERLMEYQRIHRKRNLSFPCGEYLNLVQYTHLPAGLERYDRVASLCSMEARHPLLDKRLVDFYMDVPWNQLVREGWSKFLLRKVAEQFLPQEVCWRSGKEHVGWLFNRSMLQLKHEQIVEKINFKYDTLCRFVKKEFVPNLPKKDSSDYNASNELLQADIVGLLLWLYNE